MFTRYIEHEQQSSGKRSNAAKLIGRPIRLVGMDWLGWEWDISAQHIGRERGGKSVLATPKTMAPSAKAIQALPRIVLEVASDASPI